MFKIEWESTSLRITIRVDDQKHAWLDGIRPAHALDDSHESRDHSLPLTEIRTIDEGCLFGTSERLVWSALSRRLEYVSHEAKNHGDQETLNVVLKDPQTHLRATVRFTGYKSIPVIRSTVDLKNDGSEALYVQAVSSLAIGNISGGCEKWWDDYVLWKPQSTNFREAQWRKFTFQDLGMEWCGANDFNLPGSRASCIVSNRGTFSTCGHLPMGALERQDGSLCWMWQIESSAAWRWEVGDVLNGLYLIAGGPTDQDSQWVKKLEPGDTFSSVPVAVSLVEGNHEKAFQAMTRYRRSIYRKHDDNEKMSLIFNDYMNCLMGEPTEDKIAALIEPAASCGSEYFVIDAGWYGEPDVPWWDTVGAWEPNDQRFPSGLKKTTERIRAAGMVPGLWMEPEVIGVRSPVLKDIPSDAFFQRYGRKVIEQGRYQLDFRHPIVRQRLDKIVDRLVGEFNVGYFKFDYNIDVTQGTDVDCTSPGDGLLEHRRAYMKWLNGLYDRHPALVIESCSSGGQRLDYELLASHSLQSTSDQQDAILYAPIAAGIPTAVTPEQSATWAYPQSSWDDGLIAFTVVNSLLGRVHLSGRLDQLSAAQLDLVKAGMSAYKDIRNDLRQALPFWPMGLPGWTDKWLMLGMLTESRAYIAVWRRGGSNSHDTVVDLPKPAKGDAKLLFPHGPSSEVSFDPHTKRLRVGLKAETSACLLQIEF